MLISDYTYELPEERIAQRPPEERGASRLLVLDRKSGAIEHRLYRELFEFIKPGDVIVLNNTRVIKARLNAVNAAGKQRELLLLEEHAGASWYKRRVLYRGKLHAGEELSVSNATVTVSEVLDGGIAVIQSDTNLLELAEQTGAVPLPPYMHREADQNDTERYQTVFAEKPGSVAAPTASLNFTDELKAKIEAKGGVIVYLTLHVGLGTFLPIRTDEVEQHVMHSEYFEIPAETIEAIRQAKLSSNRIFAVGTTVARTLEYNAAQLMAGNRKTLTGEANIFIYPGYEFKIVDALLTNFHAPKSTVLMLAAAFAGWDKLNQAYDEAIAESYMFLSYGDSMLIL